MMRRDPYVIMGTRAVSRLQVPTAGATPITAGTTVADTHGPKLARRERIARLRDIQTEALARAMRHRGVGDRTGAAIAAVARDAADNLVQQLNAAPLLCIRRWSGATCFLCAPIRVIISLRVCQLLFTHLYPYSE